MERRRIGKSDIYEMVENISAILMAVGYMAEKLAQDKRDAHPSALSALQTL